MGAIHGGDFGAELRRIITGVFGGGSADPRHERTFEILFRLLGHLSRIDGEVAEEEGARVVSILMDSKLPSGLRDRAMAAYAGDGSTLDLRGELERYLEVFPAGSSEVMALFENLLSLAGADGRIDTAEQVFLDELARWLGLPASYLEWKLRAPGSRSVH